MKLLRAAIAMMLASAAPVAAQQQTAQLDLRVNKLEKEMRAVQRKVFPLGEPVQPDLTPAPSTTVPGAPASTPISDLTSRVDSLEKQIVTLTAASEQNSFKIKQLEETVAKLQALITPPTLVPETPPAPAAEPDTTVPAAEPAVSRPVTPAATPARPAATTPKPATPAPAQPDPARKAGIAAIEMPATSDPVEDEYTYAFRLYTAKFYPEAEVKLKEFVAKHPAHKRASYAQNLLGRAYLDEGKPALASVAFYDNYQKMPNGERAPESLYWLGQSLIRLKKLPDACKVYDELRDVYGAKLTADLKAKAAKGRVDAKCAA